VKNKPLPEISEENLHLSEDASTADVLGVMGSWNDSPAYMAHEKGMDYRNLSSYLHGYCCIYLNNLILCF